MILWGVAVLELDSHTNQNKGLDLRTLHKSLDHHLHTPHYIALRPLTADKTGSNLKIFPFDIRGKLSIIRCDKYILYVLKLD